MVMRNIESILERQEDECIGFCGLTSYGMDGTIYIGVASYVNNTV